MPFLVKLRWDLKEGRESEFRENQEKLCTVIYDHPGVICYHVDYPSPNVSEWVEIYANDESFRAHLANEKGKAPLGRLIDASSKITCRCWGEPDDQSKKILEGFGTTYHESGVNSFALNPRADKDACV